MTMPARSPVSDCIIEAGTVLTGLDADGGMQMRHDVGIRVDRGVIAQIGPLEAVGYGQDHLPRYGSRDMIAMPGLVNAHHHFGVTPLMQGIPFAPLELWLPQFRAMRPVDTRLDTLYSAIEMLESGTTTVQHINSGLSGTPDGWMATADATLSAYGEIGMRAGFCFMIRDRNILGYDDDAEVLAGLPTDVRDWIAPKLAAAAIPISELMAFYQDLRDRWLPANGDHVRLNLAPANLHWCSDPCLQAIMDTARATGGSVHMHLLETERQRDFAYKRYGHSAVEHLKAIECLGPELTLGHGNWMSRGDLDLIADCGCTLCHNASSGLRLGSGIAPVNEMRRRGIPVSLGIDQSNIADDRDMTLEMKLVWALHRETGLFNERPDAAAVLQMATEHGARSVGFGGFTGRLVPGQQADIVLMDRRKIARPAIHPRTPIVEALLHRGGRHAIHQVFVGGRLVVDGGKVVTIDRDAVLTEIAAILERQDTPAEATARTAVETMMPHLEARLRASSLGEGQKSYRYNAMADGT
ncbi:MULTISPECIES: amidohydrolase family protein [unclassified Rhizobium]|uniref:amidohydrolase family protein n=1 Tax=Rhizobium sp. PP-CC-3G-465 TaxID=2135648 RepID=UPI000D9A7731|nr:cytosine/adenosine deaminase-related metal-dependent hydrolase [Rhizobium sp. PP-WC-1G-195]TCQ25896.1 cytosine/adenosine deaminase-related metal-dependent hydrolase [Rhizobium sp. PP-CC-3G-465]